jgi:hypothetical protein
MALNPDFELQQWEIDHSSTDMERALIFRARDGWHIVSFQTHMKPDGTLLAVALFRK